MEVGSFLRFGPRRIGQTPIGSCEHRIGILVMTTYSNEWWISTRAGKVNSVFFTEIIHSGRTLNVGSVQQIIPGLYICQASNEYGNIKHEFKISIICKSIP